MIAFLSVALLIYGSMHLYLLSKVWLAFPHSFVFGLTLACCGLVMSLSPFLLWFMARQNWHGATAVASWVLYLWMGFLFLFCCIALLLDLGHALTTLAGLQWPLSELQALRALALLSAALLAYGFFDARNIRVERVSIVTPKLSPDIGQVTIAQISDLHLGVMLGDEFLGRVIARLREIKPDIIVATGDIVDGQGDGLERLAQQLRTLKPPKGAYAITGNHEYFVGLEHSLRFLRNAGFRVLRGESAAAGGIVLVGVDDTAGLATGQETRLNPQAALASVSADTFVILLKHQPVVDMYIPFDLQLSGHVHGGQIFPFNFLTQLSYGVSSGLTQLANGRWLYVSRGTGTWGPPIRLLAAPEITLIKIEATKKPDAGNK